MWGWKAQTLVQWRQMLHGQRETSWQIPHLAPAAEWLTWSSSPKCKHGYTHRDPWLWHDIHSCSLQDPTLAAAHNPQLRKNLMDFWVMKQGENQGTKETRNIRMGSVQCCCLCISGSLSEAVKAGRLSRILVLWSQQKCELINDSAFETWIDSHTPDTLFHCHFSSPQPCSTLWVSKRNRDVFHIFLCGLKNVCPGMTDEILLSRFKISSNISPASTMPRVEHLNIQG